MEKFIDFFKDIWYGKTSLSQLCVLILSFLSTSGFYFLVQDKKWFAPIREDFNPAFIFIAFFCLFFFVIQAGCQILKHIVAWIGFRRSASEQQNEGNHLKSSEDEIPAAQSVPSPPAEAPNANENDRQAAVQKHIATFNRLSQWQKEFLMKAVRSNRQQFQNYEIGMIEAVWEPEIDVLIARRIIVKLNYSTYYINDEFFDALRENFCQQRNPYQ